MSEDTSEGFADQPHVADSIRTLLKHGDVLRFLDRSAPVDSLIAPTLVHWEYDLYSRKPAPALLEDGSLTPTDLDLACFLAALAAKKAVIALPKYSSRRPRVERVDEYVINKDMRHGQVIGLIANKDVFSFSVRIQDMNVVRQSEDGPDEIGAPRNFMLVDMDGTWHDGWKSIEFMPNKKMNSWLEDNRLWTGNTVHFQNFVHPNRWISFYGAPYLATKILIQRLEEECRFYRQEENRLLELGIVMPEPLAVPRHTSTAPSNSIQVTTLEAVVDAPYHSAYAPLSLTQDALIASHERVTKLTYTSLPELRFATRCTELAFSKWLNDGEKSLALPAWLRGLRWEAGYREPGKRTDWKRLAFTGELSLRYREWVKTERVAQ